MTKREYYMDVGVPDYLVVDREARMIEQWSPDRDTPRVLRDQLVWHPSGAREPLVVDVPAFFDRYEAKVRFLGPQRAS